jgi:hypothetical protein
MVCLYILFIQGICVLAKVYKGFRFETKLYSDFKSVASAGGCTATGAFERFMSVCVERALLVFPELNIEGFEVEARVLVDWLRKGKRFYRSENGVEVNIAGRLVELLLKVRNSELRGQMEDALKSSVSEQG